VHQAPPPQVCSSCGRGDAKAVSKKYDYLPGQGPWNSEPIATTYFDHLVTEWLKHYHEERPHQAKENSVLSAAKPRQLERKPLDECPHSGVACRERLGGLVRHYYRRAA
jgi:hypothetical protein